MKLTTFVTPFGRYGFKRLDCEITCALVHFCRRISHFLFGSEEVFCHMDDVIITGSIVEQHDARLKQWKMSAWSSVCTLPRTCHWCGRYTLWSWENKSNWDISNSKIGHRNSSISGSGKFLGMLPAFLKSYKTVAEWPGMMRAEWWGRCVRGSKEGMLPAHTHAEDILPAIASLLALLWLFVLHFQQRRGNLILLQHSPQQNAHLLGNCICFCIQESIFFQGLYSLFHESIFISHLFWNKHVLLKVADNQKPKVQKFTKHCHQKNIAPL